MYFGKALFLFFSGSSGFRGEHTVSVPDHMLVTCGLKGTVALDGFLA